MSCAGTTEQVCCHASPRRSRRGGVFAAAEFCWPSCVHDPTDRASSGERHTTAPCNRPPRCAAARHRRRRRRSWSPSPSVCRRPAVVKAAAQTPTVPAASTRSHRPPACPPACFFFFVFPSRPTPSFSFYPRSHDKRSLQSADAGVTSTGCCRRHRPRRRCWLLLLDPKSR